MSLYHCTEKQGRLILGRFYQYGDPIEIDDEHSALAFSMMQKKIVERGKFAGTVETSASDAEDSDETSKTTETSETSASDVEDTPKKTVRKKV